MSFTRNIKLGFWFMMIQIALSIIFSLFLGITLGSLFTLQGIMGMTFAKLLIILGALVGLLWGYGYGIVYLNKRITR